MNTPRLVRLRDRARANARAVLRRAGVDLRNWTNETAERPRFLEADPLCAPIIAGEFVERESFKARFQRAVAEAPAPRSHISVAALNGLDFDAIKDRLAACPPGIHEAMPFGSCCNHYGWRKPGQLTKADFDIPDRCFDQPPWPITPADLQAAVDSWPLHVSTTSTEGDGSTRSHREARSDEAP